MDNLHIIMLTLGCLLLGALALETLAQRTRLPRVTLFILFGLLLGPGVLNVLPVNIDAWYTFFADLALLMVGFLLGSKLSRSKLRKTGKVILSVSVFEILGAALAVFLGLWAMGVDPLLAILMAGIAPASAPAATNDVVEQTRAKGRFTDVLLGVVAIDDAWGLLLFSVLLATAQVLSGTGNIAASLGLGLWEGGGALVLGLVAGVPAAFLTGRIRPGEPTLIEALGLVFLCGGLALWLKVSFLLAAMMMGATVVNLARHHQRPFHEIEHVEQPLLVLFFILAGASLHLGHLMHIGMIGLVYVVLRIAGLWAGGWFGAYLAAAPEGVQKWIGLAITPQAGVALGMALIAGNRFPELKETIIALTVGTTVVFEIIGPLLTQWSLYRVKEAGDVRGGTQVKDTKLTG